MTTAATDRRGLGRVIARVRGEVVGREREIEAILATVDTGRNLLIEGPPGTGKTTLLRAITDAWEIPLVLVEGSAELTPGRLIGYHDPARVLQEGYSADAFEPGPLTRAMQSGGFLYFEELNRAPEDTLNTLLTAMADRRITVPRLGTITAVPSFRVVAAMNPYDNVGTTRLSISIRDRLCRIVLDYQDAAAERGVVTLRVGADPDDAVRAGRIADATAVTRLTREHAEVRQGASVRGAIDLALLVERLMELRAITPGDRAAYRDAFREAMLLALAGRILVDEAAQTTAERVLSEIWSDYFDGSVRPDDPG